MNSRQRKDINEKLQFWEKRVQNAKLDKDDKQKTMAENWIFGMAETLRILGEYELAEKADRIWGDI